MTNPHDLKGLVDRIRHSGVMHTSDDWTVELRLGGLRIACADPSPECAKTLGDVVRVWSAVQSGSLVPVERVRELEAENERLRDEASELLDRLQEIGNFAHQNSTGPAIPDEFWSIRDMAYAPLETASQRKERIEAEVALERPGFPFSQALKGDT